MARGLVEAGAAHRLPELTGGVEEDLLAQGPGGEVEAQLCGGPESHRLAPAGERRAVLDAEGRRPLHRQHPEEPRVGRGPDAADGQGPERHVVEVGDEVLGERHAVAVPGERELQVVGDRVGEVAEVELAGQADGEEVLGRGELGVPVVADAGGELQLHPLAPAHRAHRPRERGVHRPGRHAIPGPGHREVRGLGEEVLVVEAPAQAQVGEKRRQGRGGVGRRVGLRGLRGFDAFRSGRARGRRHRGSVWRAGRRRGDERQGDEDAGTTRLNCHLRRHQLRRRARRNGGGPGPPRPSPSPGRRRRRGSPARRGGRR